MVLLPLRNKTYLVYLYTEGCYIQKQASLGLVIEAIRYKHLSSVLYLYCVETGYKYTKIPKTHHQEMNWRLLICSYHVPHIKLAAKVRW